MSASQFWRMTKGKIMEGVFAINKPTGLSSAQVLRDLQTHFNPSELFTPWIELETAKRDRESHNQRGRRRNKRIQVKIGHGGTLDPLATGVLIAGVGSGTKSLQDFLLCTKVYEAVVLFGTATDTYDRVGKVLKRAPYDHITKEMVETALGQFRGKFMQLPPLFSALKMNGKPLYEYAREGKEIPRDIERRPVDVLELELVEWMEGGAHSHEAPTDEAGYAEVNVANRLWKQENALPAGQLKKAKSWETTGDTTQDLPSKDSAAVEETVAADGKEVKSEETEPIGLPSEETKASLPEASDQAPEGESKAVKVKVEEEDTIVKKNEEETKTDEGLASFEQTKRKLVEAQDDLIHEQPASKQRKKGASSEDAIMSGGLAAPEQTSETTQSTSDAKVTDSPSTKPKGPPAVRLRMTVTSGFYVRSLCHDLGAAVGSAALMAELERTRQGDFELGKNVLEYDDLQHGEKVWGPKVETMLDEWHEKGKTKPRD